MQRSKPPWILIAMCIALAFLALHLDSDTGRKFERIWRGIAEINEELAHVEIRLAELQFRVRAHSETHEAPPSPQGGTLGSPD